MVNKTVTPRTAWHDLIKLTFEGVELVETRQAASYLGMHNKAFLRLCSDKDTKPDLNWLGHNLYSRATLDNIDHQRNQPGRPSKVSPSAGGS